LQFQTNSELLSSALRVKEIEGELKAGNDQIYKPWRSPEPLV